MELNGQLFREFDSAIAQGVADTSIRSDGTLDLTDRLLTPGGRP